MVILVPVQVVAEGRGLVAVVVLLPVVAPVQVVEVEVVEIELCREMGDGV